MTEVETPLRACGGPDGLHAFLTYPGRCSFCGVHSDELRRRSEHQMLVEAFTRLATVLEKLEAKL